MSDRIHNEQPILLIQKCAARQVEGAFTGASAKDILVQMSKIPDQSPTVIAIDGEETSFRINQRIVGE